MTNVENTKPASVAERSAQFAPLKTSSKKQAIPNKVAPKARKSANGTKLKKNPHPKARPGSKSAKVLELLAGTNGVSLAELMKATQWQAHSIRGFLSTASRKRGVKIESFKNAKDQRAYRVTK
jgi:hypothetical protein